MILNILSRIIEFSIIGIAFFLPLSSGVVNSLIGIAIVCWITKKVVKKDIRIKPAGLNIPLFLFFVISCVSIFNSIEPSTSLKGLIKVLKYLGIYFVMVENIGDIKTVKRIISALILGAVVVCIDGLIQYVIGSDILRSNPLIINVGLKRMTAAYRHCNDFGVYLVSIVGVIWSLALYEFKKRMKFMVLLAAFLVTLCTVLTFSRGAALAFYGLMLLMGIIKKDKLVLAILVISLIAMPFLIPSGVKEWSKETHSFLEFFCNLDRIAFYKSSIQMIKDHPVIGVGINTFSKAYYKYKVTDVDIITADTCYAHNNYLQMAGEIGLVGLGIFLWILIALFLELKKIYINKEQLSFVKNAALGLACGALAFLLNGLTESSFYFSKIVVVFWFMAGLALSLKFIKNDYTD